jgi:hypothetical protein
VLKGLTYLVDALTYCVYLQIENFLQDSYKYTGEVKKI